MSGPIGSLAYNVASNYILPNPNIRDLMAMNALGGMINASHMPAYPGRALTKEEQQQMNQRANFIADLSYQMADAMMSARNKNQSLRFWA